MCRRWCAVALALVMVGGWWAEASAQWPWASMVRGDTAIITIDVLPLEAEVRLDGVVLGTARELTAQVVPVLPGAHVLEVSAAGYRPGGVRFSSYRNGANQVQVQLVPNRR
jgi:hypothetical protein